MSQNLKKRVDDVFGMSAEELKGALPSTLEEIRKYGIGKMIEEAPDLLYSIIGKLVKVDAARFAKDAPEATEKFMDFLWESASVLVDKSDELRAILESVDDVSVNLDASDSPFKSHFSVKSGKLSGGWGLMRFKDQDYRFLGPTKALLETLAGDLNFPVAIRTKLKFEGHPTYMVKAGRIVGRIMPRIIKGK